MLKFGIIGLGQGGCNVADYAYSKNFKAVAINTATIDLNSLKYIPKENRLFLPGYNGAGRNREIGKAAVIEHANKVLELVKNKVSDCDCVFIAAAGGGGTGSGALPVVTDIVLELYSFVNIICIFPDDIESTASKMNAHDCFSELSENPQIGSIFILDNQKGKILNPNTPKFKIHQKVNNNIIDLLCEINEFTNKQSYTNNFDDRDLMEMLTTRGCTLISKTTNIKDVETDNEISASITDSWYKMPTPEYDISKALKVAVLGNVIEELSYNVNLEKIFNGNIPYDIKDSLYNEDNDETLFYSVFSGLSFPSERIYKMKEDIEKVKDDLIKKIETSQNQKIENVDWEIELPIMRKNKKVNDVSLSEKLKKFQ